MKKHVVEEMRQAHGITLSEAETAFDRVVGGISSVVRRGDDVRLPGIGTLKKKYQEPRTGRNPATGEAISIQGKDVLKFKAAKDAV